MQFSSDDLRRLYEDRFTGHAAERDTTWQILCHDFFQKWIPRTAVVLDIAAGHCDFINNIEAARRIAVDLNSELPERAAAGVETHITASNDLSMLDDASVDRVFISNFFEHIPREVIVATLLEARRVLRPDGLLLLLQPNIRYLARDYWRFFDHITPIDDRAMSEAFVHCGYRVVTKIPRFLPYTTVGRLPRWPILVRAYLRFPPIWRVFGGQAFMVATPAA